MKPPKSGLDKKKGTNVTRPSHKIVEGAKTNNLEEVKLALWENPDCINASDKSGLTALHWAASNNNFTLCEYLFEQSKVRVNPMLKDVRGRSAMDHAIGIGSDAIINLFYSHILRPDMENDDPPHSGEGKVITPDFKRKEPK
ncbi:hypothetical protein GC177_00500 [bacterium]|nr:hypothetical protein [bacterium]